MMSLRIEKGVLLVTALLALLVKEISSCPNKCVCIGNQQDGITVTCNHANLTSLPSNISTDTVELQIQGNNITRIGNDSFLNLTRLERLYLQDNQIHYIEYGAFRGLERLRVLKLSDNPIVKIDIFNGLDTLEELDVNRSGLTSLDAGSFSGLLALKRLSLDSNRIEQISTQMFDGLTVLEMLSVEDNRLFELPLSESASSSLRQLCLSGNPLSTIGEKPFLNYDVLEILHMSRVSSSGEIPDDIFDGIEDTLTELGIGSNNLTRVPAAIQKLNKLKILDLSGNKLHEFDYSTAMAKLDLQKLSLSHNRFTNLPSEVLPMFANLEELSLDDNSITSVPSKVLSRCTLLQFVSLKNNQITKVSNDAFRGLQNLKSVDLSGNNLTTLSDGPFVGTRGMSLLIDGNPWHCDCRVLWLAKWYEDGKINHGKAIPTCQTPQSLKDQSLFDLSVEILSDCKKPVATSDLSALTAKKDTTVTLSCRVDGFPTPTVAWYTTHGKITSESPNDTYDKKYTIQNTSLNINNVEVSDQGKYTCFAGNVVGNASVDITLSVTVEPTPTTSLKLTVTHTPAYTMKSTLHPSIKQRTGSELSQSDLGMLIFGSFTIVAIGVSVLVHWYCKKRQREDDEEHRSIAYDNRTFSAFDDSDVEII